MKDTHIIGIDEVGRGPVAGPVSVCALLTHTDFLKTELPLDQLPLRDSKKLTAKQREKWLVWILQQKDISFCFTSVSSQIIDRKGIEGATRLAVQRVLARMRQLSPVDHTVKILLDGRLYAPKTYVNQETISGGDKTEPAISLASIVAKVLRDRKMKRLSKKYKEYELDIHKGYGTQAHYEHIKRHGLSDIHRKSFLKNVQ